MLLAGEWTIYARQLDCMINDLPWQKPNSTEFFASTRLLQDSDNFHDNFVPYPWATWIDRKAREN